MQSENDWQNRAQEAWDATSAKVSAMFSQQRRGSSIPWGVLLTGAALGLIVGLLIGWVVWPVQWEGARPSHLDPDAQAQYVAAVADAYTAAGGTSEALEQANRRLAGLDREQAILDAQRYFVANNRAAMGEELSDAERLLVENDIYGQRLADDANIRLNNLNQLAAGFGIEGLGAADLPLTGQDETGPVAAPGADIAPEQAVDSPGEVGAPAGAAPPTTTGPGILRILSIVLAFLATLLLIGGGIFVLYRLNQQRERTSVVDSDAQQVPFGAGSGDDGFGYNEPYENEREYNDMPGEIGGFSFEHSGNDIEPFAPEDVSEGAQVWTDKGVSMATAGVASAYDESVLEDGPFYDAPNEPERGEEANQEPYEAPQVLASSRGELLSEFTAQYDAGMTPTYEEKRNIVLKAANESNGTVVGEYGMGVNIKNGVRPDNPQDVIAMDVWLFDKSDERNLHNRTLVLLSNYAVENELAGAISGERSDDPEPVVPQPGARYQLQGVDLILDCQILDVEFASEDDGEGVFESLEVHMRVFKRGGHA